jgi:hypothetical protein
MRRRRLAGIAGALAFILVAAGGLPAGASAPTRSLEVSNAPVRPGTPSWLTAADLVDDVPTAVSLAAVRAGLPSDPVQAATDLVQTIFGSDRAAAVAATGEVLRRAGMPLVSALGPIVAMPDHAVIVNVPVEVELLPMLTDSVRGGIFYTPDQVGLMLRLAGASTSTLTGAQVVGILDQWGKGPSDPAESVVAGATARALAAHRHQLLIPSMAVDTRTEQLAKTDPGSLDPTLRSELSSPARLLGLDVLQTLLLAAHAVSRLQTDGAGLRGSNPAAAADSPCPDMNTAAGKVASGVAKGGLQAGVAEAAGKVSGAAGKVGAQQANEAINDGEQVIESVLLLAGAHIDVAADKDATHFRHQSGDTSRDVHLTATASFHSPLGGTDLNCWAFAGISVPPDGPLTGIKITWKITGSPDVLDVVGSDANKVQDGQTTGPDGTSTLETYPMTEKDPPKDGEDQPEQTVPQVVIASLSKDSFPFSPADLLKLTNGPYAAAAQELIQVMQGVAQKVGLPSASTTIDVTYHGANPYVAKGESSLDVILASVHLQADLYSCKGPEGPWKGTATLSGQLADIYKIVGQTTSGTLSGTVNFSLNPQSASPQTFDVQPKFQVQITLDPTAVQDAEHPPTGAGGNDRILSGAVIGKGTWVVNGQNWADDAATLGPLVPTPGFQLRSEQNDSRCPGSSLSDDFFDPYG